MFVWDRDRWTDHLRWDAAALLAPLSAARQRQGRLLGLARHVGFDPPAHQLGALVEEALSTSVIEGERLDRDSVRSSVARRLGLPGGSAAHDRRVDGVVDVLLDATVRAGLPVTTDRLKSWHAALFPTGWSGVRPIAVAQWRPGPEPMRVVSGALGGPEVVHFEAPPFERVPVEMEAFLAWFEAARPADDGMVRAGLAHLWFLTVHPFDDGNGRIARALAELSLARDEASTPRLWSLSGQILRERDAYYRELERAQRGDGEITPWLSWFLGCVERALAAAEDRFEGTLRETRFWHRHHERPLNERQRKVVARLLEAGPDGFEGGMTNRKVAALTRASRATAQRDLAELVAWGLLVPRSAGGRSAAYDLAW